MTINEQNLNRWFALHDKMRNLKGFDKLTRDERKFMLEFHADVDQEKLSEYVNGLNESDPKKAAEWRAKLTPENMAMLENEFRKNIANNKEAALEIGKELEKERKTKNITQALDMFLAGSDYASAKKQINLFESESKKSKRPSRPPSLQRDPYLAAVKDEANRGLYDESTAIEAAKGGIQDAYLGDLANARIASGGQQAAFGAYAQSAVNRRGRRSLELAPMANQIRQQQRERRDRLAGLSSSENQAIQQSMAQYYPTDLNQYQFEQQQLANLGQAGYKNRRTALGEIANTIPGAIDRYTEQKYNKYYSALGPQWADELMQADKELERTNKSMYYDEFGNPI